MISLVSNEQRSDRAPGSRLAVLMIWLAVSVAILALAACGGGDSETPAATGTTATSVAANGADATSITQNSAAGLATAITDAWAEAMQRLVAVIESKPDAASVKPEIEDLKEESIQKLVELGRTRQTLSATEQADVDSLVSMALMTLGSEPWYETYMDVYDHYSTGDLEFANLLASFNILTQYADFALLKQQAPEEAARLGIE